MELEGKGGLLDDDITEDYAVWLIRNNGKIQWNFIIGIRMSIIGLRRGHFDDLSIAHGILIQITVDGFV